MYVSITGNKTNQDVYIKYSYRKENGKTSSRIYKKLGKLNDLLEQFAGDKEKLMDWAKDQATMETELYKQKNGKISVEFSQAATIPLNEQRSFNVGYLFLQDLCTQLRLDKICRTIKDRHKFKYDFHAILTDLIFARILSPSSKLASYEYCQSLLEPPKYSLQDVYRSHLSHINFFHFILNYILSSPPFYSSMKQIIKVFLNLLVNFAIFFFFSLYICSHLPFALIITETG